MSNTNGWMKSDWTSPKHLLLVLIVAGIPAAIILVYASISAEQSLAARNWPTAIGTIVSSKLTSHDNEGSTFYGLEIKYEYRVGIHKFFNDQKSFGGDITTTNSTQAQMNLDQYPRGSNVTVYYNPDDPSQAVLEPGLNELHYWLFAFGGGIIVISCLMTVIGWLIKKHYKR